MGKNDEILVDKDLVTELWKKMNDCNQYLYTELEQLKTDTSDFLENIKGDFSGEFCTISRHWESSIDSCQRNFSNLCINFLNIATEIVERDKTMSAEMGR